MSPPLALPGVGTADLWLCDIDTIHDPLLLACYRELLDDGELARMQRFVFPQDRHRLLVAHAMLRSVLSLYGDTAAATWRFVTGVHGKPALAAETTLPDADFNLSHSGPFAVLAVSSGCRYTGVDIEFHRPARNFHGLAERHFASSEAQRLHALGEPELSAEFYDIWTLKEAFVKAVGEGLTQSLGDFCFGFERASGWLDFDARSALEPDPAGWKFWCYRIDGPCSVALALRMGGIAAMQEPRWHRIVPQREWWTIDVPCVMRSRRITANPRFGDAMR